MVYNGLDYGSGYQGFIASPACDACGTPFETRSHFLLACPAWEHLRPPGPLYRASMEAGSFGALLLSTLLNDNLLINPMAKFLELTGRLNGS
ncbi:hypothetical protein C8J57DRAFT_1510632 [Mycena rebaudengoi]|nr:hypothetical protein C8J57DRAFT_1510632 [Mycena rebaudengoi]